ncbi:MAG: molecular chaperone TorD family protein [Candidatus Melainabacteria bacterium]|nr:molecular chaperone TorD family protein [Candidatus Melainabacteria bacterium]
MVDSLTEKGKAMCSLAALLEYPGESFFEDAERVAVILQENRPRAAASIRKFLANTGEKNPKDPVSEMEELFTRTFDIAPIVCPYITAHIYGDENFDRGRLMSALSSKFLERGFAPGAELPDHIAVLLRFAPYLDEEELTELSELCLRQPIAAMTDSLRDAGSPYLYVFEALQTTIEGVGRHD